MKTVMMTRISRVILLTLALMAISNCAESTRPVATGKGSIRAMNASVTSPAVVFLLEERTISIPDYKESTAPRAFDDLDYVVNFDFQFIGDTIPTRLLSIPLNLVKDTDYLFIFTGSLAAPGSLLWERPIRVWDGTETVMQVEFGHVSTQLGEVDVYFTTGGTAPVSGQARATLTNGNHSSLIELPADDYTLFFTSKDNPADILFSSPASSYAAATDHLITVFDGDPSITSAVAVRAFTSAGSTTELFDVSAIPTLRAFHTAPSTGPVDLYRGSDFTVPLIANVANNSVSLAVDSIPDEVTHTFTDAGNVGAVLLEEDFGIAAAQHTTRFLTGDPASLQTIITVDDFRPVDAIAKVRLIQASFNQIAVDVYLVEGGSDITDETASFSSLAFQTSTGYFNVLDTTFNVIVTTPGTKDILAGPLSFDAADGDVIHFAITDTPDPNLLDILKYDHRDASGQL